MGTLPQRSPDAVSIYALTAAAAGFSDMYVGATSRPVYWRKASHVTEAFVKTKTRPVNRWVRAVIEAGRDLELAVLEVVPPGGNWPESEQFHIAYFRALGLSLVNTRAGGVGAVGGQPRSVRAKISAAHISLGKTLPPAHVAKLQEAVAARRAVGPIPVSAATRAKLRAAHEGKPKPPEQVAKQRASLLETNRRKKEAAKVRQENFEWPPLPKRRSRSANTGSRTED